MTLMFESGVPDGVRAGVESHIFVLHPLVPQVPGDILLLVESVVLPIDPPPGAQYSAAISVTGG